MEIVIKLVTALGTVGVVIGLFAVYTGYMKFSTGQKNDNGPAVDQGIQSMVLGGVMAAMSGGIAATIIAALNNLPK
ncbi:hypothetical protein ESZ50_10235 [Weissella muntiaci]|uniref:Uncharacterized protein n=1 Tax=Weissella muntiaci TaxID=2508881 RepID=A0A6C2C2S1_9LACO|nr:hypothetical protein [Weissella muntiaci]TYC47999.1 hypothetical protein ESZ50_10235 [Weissella muntiaci]